MRKEYYDDYVKTSKYLLRHLCKEYSVACLYTGGKDSSIVGDLLREAEVKFVFFANSGFANHMSVTDEATLDFFKEIKVEVEIIQDPAKDICSESERWIEWLICLRKKGYDAIVCGNRWDDNARDFWEKPPSLVHEDTSGIIVSYPLNIWTDGHVWRYIGDHQLQVITHE